MKNNSVEFIFEKSSPIIASYLDQAYFNMLEENIRSSLFKNTPTVMVYGVYNAGKSTLINALCGKYIALEGGVPTTATINRYTWRNYTILDTPGIDAPVAHETITQEQLDKSDVVLFVVNSASAVDAINTYEAIIDLLKRKRKAMIVINDFECDLDAFPSLTVTDKVRQNLQLKAEKENLDQKAVLATIPIFWLNAKSALKSREENKRLLESGSGIIEFEEALENLIKSTNADDIVKRVKSDLQNGLSCAIDEILVLIEQSDTRDLERLSKKLEVESQHIKVKANEIIDQHKTKIYSNLLDWINHSADDINTLYPALLTEFANELMEFLQTEVANLYRSLQTEVTSIELNNCEVNASKIDLEQLSGGDAPAKKSINDFVLPKETLNALIDVVRPEHIQVALHTVKHYFPSLMVGIGAKTIEKTASAVASKLPYIGPVITGVFSLVEYYQTERAIKEESLAQARYQQSVIDTAQQASQSYVIQMRNKVDEVLTASLSSPRQVIDSQFLEIDQKSHGYKQDLSTLRQLQQALDL